MKKQRVSPGYVFIVSMKIWASVWLAFFIAIVPMYIWRGSYYEDVDIRAFGEHVIMTVTGLWAGFLILMCMHGKSDEAERLDGASIWITAAGAVGIYVTAWMLLWAIGKNNYWIAGCGYHLETMLGVDANNRPTFSSAIMAALVYGLCYFFAIIAGTKIAHRRKNRFCAR